MLRGNVSVSLNAPRPCSNVNPASAKKPRDYLSAASITEAYELKDAQQFAVSGGCPHPGREVAPFFAVEPRLGSGLQSKYRLSQIMWPFTMALPECSPR